MFSRNLRERLSRRGAVARAEDATGISRVQLNRYLNGTIPNEANLATLCSYLGVEEHEMFEDLQLSTATNVWKRTNRPADVVGYGPTCSYILYFSVPFTSDYVVRSVLNLTKTRDSEVFTRHTSFDLVGGVEQRPFIHIHQGYVSRIGGYEYFAGVHDEHPFEPSLVYLGRTNSGRIGYEGEALVWSVRGPVTLKIVAQKLICPIAEEDISANVGALARSNERQYIEIIELLNSTVPPDINAG